MSLDLATAAAVTRQKIEDNEERFAELSQSVEGFGQDVTDHLDHLKSAMRHVEPDATADISSAGVLLSAFRDELVRDVDDIADGADDIVEEVVDRLEAVVRAFESFDREVTQTIANLFDQIDEGMQAVGEDVVSLGEEITDALSGRLETAKDEISNKLEDLLNTERTELLDEVEAALSEAIEGLSGTAQSLGERTRDEIGDIWLDLASRTEERFKTVLQDSVDQIAQQVVQETAQQVVEDIGLTQLSAQVTMGLQSQLPNLTAAKYSVAAVKSLLDAF